MSEALDSIKCVLKDFIFTPLNLDNEYIYKNKKGANLAPSS